MVLRLLLVGLVAGLGFTFPGRRDIDTLSRSAQRWMRAQVAAWEAQRAPREATFVFLANVPEPAPRVTAQPTVSDQAFTAVVEEMVSEFAQAELASRPHDADDPLMPAAEIVPVAQSDSLAIAPPSEPAVADIVVAEPVVAEPVVAGPAEPATTDVAFESIVDEMILSFSAELADAQPAPAPAADPVLEELMAAIALEPAMVEMPLDHPEATQPAEALSEPVEAAEEFYDDEAYVLDSDSELSEPASPEPEPAPAAAATVEPESRQSRLTNAVRLTREAVYAWTSLLHGPAVVTIAP